jgi:hypothetical protein
MAGPGTRGSVGRQAGDLFDDEVGEGVDETGAELVLEDDDFEGSIAAGRGARPPACRPDLVEDRRAGGDGEAEAVGHQVLDGVEAAQLGRHVELLRRNARRREELVHQLADRVARLPVEQRQRGQLLGLDRLLARQRVAGGTISSRSSRPALRRSRVGWSVTISMRPTSRLRSITRFSTSWELPTETRGTTRG